MMIFVYGSLKPGGWSHSLLEDSVEGEPVWGTVKGSLYDAGSFPALKLDDRGVVQGLLYSIKPDSRNDLIAALDELEGHPNLFGRMFMPVTLGNCTEFALAYYGNDERLFYESDRIDSGFWDV